MLKILLQRLKGKQEQKARLPIPMDLCDAIAWAAIKETTATYESIANRFGYTVVGERTDGLLDLQNVDSIPSKQFLSNRIAELEREVSTPILVSISRLVDQLADARAENQVLRTKLQSCKYAKCAYLTKT